MSHVTIASIVRRIATLKPACVCKDLVHSWLDHWSTRLQLWNVCMTNLHTRNTQLFLFFNTFSSRYTWILLAHCYCLVLKRTPCTCMLVRFKMAQPESFTTLFLEGQPGRYHGTLFMLPNPNITYMQKWLAVSFVQRITRASLENSFHPIGLLCKTQGLISDRLLAWKADIFFQLLTFSFTERYWLFGNFSRPTSRSSPAWEILGVIWW